MKVKHILISADGKYYSAKRKGGVNNPEAFCEFKQSVQCHEGKGIVGDRFYNWAENFKGQITFISYELHQALEKHMNKEIPLELYRRNIFVTGLDPYELVGKKFRVGEIEFEGTEECTPCKFMEEFIGEGAKEWMSQYHSGGLRAKVLSSGTLSINDELIN